MDNYNNMMTARFTFMGLKQDDIFFDVHPKLQEDIEFDISIRPKNGMTAIFDLVEVPIVSVPLNPVEDTFITTNAPYNSINFGNANSMLIGSDEKGEHRGLMRFDVSVIDPNFIIKNSTLRIYYSDLIPNANINLYTTVGEWSELGVTYLNKPGIKNFLTNSYILGTTEPYIEFDVTQIVSDWVKGIPNDGFYLLSNDFASTFRTRESSLSPALTVSYLNPAPPKIAYSKAEFEVMIKGLGNNDISFEIEPGTIYSNADIEFEVFAHDPNNIYTEDIEWELNTVEAVPIQEDTNIEWEVKSVQPGFNQIEWELTVSEKEADNDIEFEIEILTEYKFEDNNIEFEITIEENFNNSDIEFDIDIKVFEKSQIEFDVELIKNGHYSDVEFQIDIKIFEDSEIEWDIYIPHSDIEFDVTPIFKGDNQIEFDIIPRVIYVSDIEFDVGVPFTEGNDDIEFEIDAKARRRYSYVFII